MTQARADLADLVNRVAYSGERVMLTRHGKPLAALVPVADLESLERRGEIGFELPRSAEPAAAEPPARPAEEAGEDASPARVDPLRNVARHRPEGSPHRPADG